MTQVAGVKHGTLRSVYIIYPSISLQLLLKIGKNISTYTKFVL